MGKAIIDEDTLTGIADAIRTKKGTSDSIPTTNMRSEILSISGGGEISHREVSSIICDGASYIKTGIYPTPFYSIEMKCRIHTIVDNHYDFLFGTRYDDIGRWHARFNKTSDKNGILCFQRSPYFMTDGIWFDSTCTRDDCSDYKVFKMEKLGVYIDNELVNTFEDAGIYQHGHFPCELYIFASNNADALTGSSPLTSAGYVDCEYVKIWDANDELVLHLIPVVKSDGTVCMYDEITERYYYNAGTGAFSYSE